MPRKIALLVRIAQAALHLDKGPVLHASFDFGGLIEVKIPGYDAGKSAKTGFNFVTRLPDCEPGQNAQQQHRGSLPAKAGYARQHHEQTQRQLERLTALRAGPAPSSAWEAALTNPVTITIDIGFAQRRKTVRNAFLEWAGSGNESAERLLAASIDPARRGETLGVEA